MQVKGEDLRTTEKFTNLGSTDRCDRGAGNDVKNRLSKARKAFRMHNNVWRSKQYSTKTKLKLFQTCVLSTLLYGSEGWRMTASDLNKLSVFHTRTISNDPLPARCRQDSMETIIIRRRWRWIRHVLRKESGYITRTVLHWTPQGKRKRGRPKNTWR